MLTLVTLNRKAVGLPVPSWPIAAWCWGAVPCCGCWVLGADPPTLLPPSSLSGRPDTCCSSVTYALVIHLKEGPRLLFFPERRKMLEALLMASEYEEYTMFLIDSEANNSESHKAALSSEGAGICEDRFFSGQATNLAGIMASPSPCLWGCSCILQIHALVLLPARLSRRISLL